MGIKEDRVFTHVKNKANCFSQSTIGIKDENSLHYVQLSCTARHLAPPGQHPRNGSRSPQACDNQNHSQIFPSVPK